MGEMNFSLRDIYPEYYGTETSVEVVPDADDKQALSEGGTEAVNSDNKRARGKNIVIAVLVLVAVVIFLGSE